MVKRFVIILLLALLIVCTGCDSSRQNILLTGYWPPSNDMLRQFSYDPAINGGDWQGENWRGLGYDVYAYFPTFPDGTDAQPQGTGALTVDYQRTLADMNMLTAKLNPVAIISFGQGQGPQEIEYNAVNRTDWHDDYIAPKQPAVNPPDAERPVGSIIHSTLPVEQIASAVNNADLGIRAWVDRDGDPGKFLCNYIAYYVCKYQSETENCKAAGFIHVGKNVSTEKAAAATEITLQKTIESIQSNKK